MEGRGGYRERRGEGRRGEGKRGGRAVRGYSLLTLSLLNKIEGVLWGSGSVFKAGVFQPCYASATYY